MSLGFLERAAWPGRPSASDPSVPRAFRGQQESSQGMGDAGPSLSCEGPGGECQRPGGRDRPAPREGHGRAALREGERGRRHPPRPQPQTPAPLVAAGQVPPGPPLGPPPGCGDDRLEPGGQSGGAGAAGAGPGAGRRLAGSRRRALFTARIRAGRGGRKLELAAGGLRARSGSCFLRGVAGRGGARPIAPTRDCGAEPSEGAPGGRGVGPRKSSELLGAPPAALHAPAAARLLARSLTAPAAPGSPHALRAPGAVGCSCAAAPRAGGGAAAVGGVNGSPFQLHLHLAAARTLRHGRAAHQRWVPAGRPRRGLSAEGRAGVPGRPLPRAFEGGCQGFVSGGRGFLPRWSPQVATSCLFLEVAAVASRPPPLGCPGAGAWRWSQTSGQVVVKMFL